MPKYHTIKEMHNKYITTLVENSFTICKLTGEPTHSALKKKCAGATCPSYINKCLKVKYKKNFCIIKVATIKVWIVPCIRLPYHLKVKYPSPPLSAVLKSFPQNKSRTYLKATL